MFRHLWLLVKNRDRLQIALQIVEMVVEGARNIHEARLRLAVKAKAGDLDDSIAKIRSLRP